MFIRRLDIDRHIGCGKRRSDRDNQAQNRPFVFASAFRPYPTTVQFNQMLGQDEAQSGSLIVLVFGGFRLLEWLEDPINVLRLQTNAA